MQSAAVAKYELTAERKLAFLVVYAECSMAIRSYFNSLLEFNFLYSHVFSLVLLEC